MLASFPRARRAAKRLSAFSLRLGGRSCRCGLHYDRWCTVDLHDALYNNNTPFDYGSLVAMRFVGRPASSRMCLEQGTYPKSL